MARLGIRGGWLEPPLRRLSDPFADEAEKATGIRFSEEQLSGFELANFDFILARRKAACEASFGPTKALLEKWLVAFQVLDKSFGDAIDDWDITTAGALSEIARQSDKSSGMKLPDPSKLRVDIEVMQLLTSRALAHLKATHGTKSGAGPRGRETDSDLETWFEQVAEIVQHAGGKIGEETSRGPRLESGFCKLIRLLCAELPSKDVHLPATVIDRLGKWFRNRSE